jgi:hypothetical protein
METWKHIRAILLLPFIVTVVIPGTILQLMGPDTLGLWQLAPATRVGLPVLMRVRDELPGEAQQPLPGVAGQGARARMVGRKRRS